MRKTNRRTKPHRRNRPRSQSARRRPSSGPPRPGGARPPNKLVLAMMAPLVAALVEGPPREEGRDGGA